MSLYERFGISLMRDRGATFVEYAPLIALIAVALIFAVLSFSDGLETAFTGQAIAGNSMSQASG